MIAFNVPLLNVLIALWLPFLEVGAGSEMEQPRQSFYSGSIQSCRPCHQKIVDTFAQSAHFKTSADANAESIKGSFSEGHNILRTRSENTYFKMESRENGFYQTSVESAKNRSRTERIDLVIGSGRKGQSYLYWKNGLLFQLPVSYLAGINEWVNSPGYIDGQINFERVIGPRCLECHSTDFKLEADSRTAKYSSKYELGISCQKCHGLGNKHVEYHSSHPAEATGKYILNPARFSRERKLDNCALCHSGAWEPTNAPFSYRPGERLDEYRPPESDRNNLTADVHGNQIGLLLRSKCFRSSGEMSCSTCHDVHQQERDLIQFAAKCLQCHQVSHCKMAGRVGIRLMNYCIECHMPNQKSRLIKINTPTKQFSPDYRSHAIGIYPKVAEMVLQSWREK
ncbi:MAG TPA: multiheme c-type cytochrome [Acidobacteriota bacterium]